MLTIWVNEIFQSETFQRKLCFFDIRFYLFQYFGLMDFSFISSFFFLYYLQIIAFLTTQRHVFSLLKLWSSVCVGWLLLGMGPVLGVVTMHSVTQLKKTDSISPSSFLLAVDTWLEVGFRLIFTPLYWDFVWLQLVQVLCAQTPSLWVLKCTVSAVAGRCCFLMSSTLRIFPHPSLYRSWSGQCGRDTLLKARHPKTFCAPHVGHL